MAITRVAYYILKHAFDQGVLPQGGSILELGEANWYRDMSIEKIEAEVNELVSDEAECQQLIARLRNSSNPIHDFDVAKVIYRILFNPKRMVAIDLDGTDAALKHNLNEPLDIDGRFDVTINNGTAEHVFNVGQVYKTIHDMTAVNGLMIHEGPFTGWYNHGFYNLQPTLYYDIAAANNYGLMGLFCCAHTPPKIIQINSPQELLSNVRNKLIPENSVLFVLFRKTEDAPFVYPIQGYYDGRLDAEQQDAWQELRST